MASADRAAAAPCVLMRMQDSAGQEVSLAVEPGDDFHTFLRKAKDLLGFEVDVSCITQNQIVSLSENLYDFLINADESQFNQAANQGSPTESAQQLLELPAQSSEAVYILDDGTQIKASQIQDNVCPTVLDVNKIPFKKFKQTRDHNQSDMVPSSPALTKVISISQSPITRVDTIQSNQSFVNSLPFQPVVHDLHPELIRYMCQTTDVSCKSEQDEPSKEPRSKLEATDEYILMRKRILNMLKNSPIQKGRPFFITRADKHVRKTDPKPSAKKVVEPVDNLAEVDSAEKLKTKSPSKCSVCSTEVQDERDEIYVFSSKDQMKYRSSPDRELAVKVICKTCLDVKFTLSRELASEKTLENEEYLVIEHNQQYVYKKINGSDFRRSPKNDDSEKQTEKSNSDPIIKLESTESGNIITQTIKDDEKSIEFKLENLKRKLMTSVHVRDSGKDPGKEPNEDLDDQVQKFLAKKIDKSLKCRFCSQVFEELDAVVEHSSRHHLADEHVYPCPLCEYGYQTLSWLKNHMRSKHQPQKGPLTFREEAKEEVATPSPSSESEDNECQTPVALRTRRATAQKRSPLPRMKKEKNKRKKIKKTDVGKSLTTTASTENLIRILEGDKNDAGSADDDGIWIVESKAADKKVTHESESPEKSKIHKCSFCNKRFISKETLDAHEMRRCNARKGKAHTPGPVCISEDVYMPSEADFLKRAKGRKIQDVQWLDEDDGTLRPRYRGRRRGAKVASDPSLLVCDDCGATFTSKVRLKFHIQFHNECALRTSDGRYSCGRCGAGDNTFATEAELFDHLHFSHGKRSRWICPVSGCHKTFFLRAMLTKHSRAHTDTRRYICGVCDKRFLDKQTLDEHSVTHLKIKPFQCHLCYKQLTRRSRLRMHLRAHEEHLAPRLVRACLACQRAFKNYAEAEEHARTSVCAIKQDELQASEARGSPKSGVVTMHIENLDPDAKECDETERFTLPNPQQKILHIRFNPSDTKELQSMISEMTEEVRRLIRIVKIEKAFRCEYCEDVFYLESTLNLHRVQHKGVKNPFTCHICKVTFPTYSRCTTHKTTHGFFKRSVAEAKREDSASEAVRAVTEQAGPAADGIVGYGDFPVCKHFLCEDCGRSYLHWTYLQVHRRMKHPVGNCVYKCGECDVVFPNSWGLAYHKRKMHGPNPPSQERKARNGDVKLPCRDCNECFTNKSALYTHRRKEHITERKPYTPKGLGLFSCATCGKCYAGRPGLEAHLRSHGAGECGDAPYACARCGVAYQSSALLTRHIITMHAEEASQMCATCGAKFALPAQLSAHVRSHSPRRTPPPRAHACPACARAFRTASMLAEHARIHTGERPYPCDLCPMSFRRSTARRNHRLIHTGERPYACSQCPKQFRIRSDMRTHFRTKHPHQIIVLEVKGLNPEPEAVIEKLHFNDIALDKVLEIAKISFPKGSANLMLDPDATLENLQRAQDEGSARWSERVMAALASCQPKRPRPPPPPPHAYVCGVRRGRGIARRDRGLVPAAAAAARDDALQLRYGDQKTFHVEIRDVAADDLTQLLGGTLTSDGRGVLLNSGEFVPFDSVTGGRPRPNLPQPPDPLVYYPVAGLGNNLSHVTDGGSWQEGDRGADYMHDNGRSQINAAQESTYEGRPFQEDTNEYASHGLTHEGRLLQEEARGFSVEGERDSAWQETYQSADYMHDNGRSQSDAAQESTYDGRPFREKTNEYAAEGSTYEGESLQQEIGGYAAGMNSGVDEGERDALPFEENPNQELMNVDILNSQTYDKAPRSLQDGMDGIQFGNDLNVCGANDEEYKYKFEKEPNVASAVDNNQVGEEDAQEITYEGQPLQQETRGYAAGMNIGVVDAAPLERDPSQEYINVDILHPMLYDKAPETLLVDMESVPFGNVSNLCGANDDE